MAKEQSDEEVTRGVVDRLVEKLPDVPRNQIESVATAELQTFAGRPVSDYRAILTERATKKQFKFALESR
ncbi:three-helix bundle dimerization domain-containing protein [Herbiconiux liangxiaofengii]|uniref:three-helix bundle dimerization domain-containing protein n=1 Tax=Herbiconiux liangxiaofengii TaxID=3342795 RepID=UPI0035B93570